MFKDLSRESTIGSFYAELYDAWGPQHWWPAQTRFEMILGAYLTQNTAWTNVEQALKRLRSARVLSQEGIRRTPLSELEQLIKSAGYFRQKAQRLKLFVVFLDEKYGGSLERMFARPTAELREELLSLNGVGPETADSILLYAGNHPVFVVDAYTRRICARHGILPLDAPYKEIQMLFEGALSNNLPRPGSSGRRPETSFRGAAHSPSRMSTSSRTSLVQIYSEMHALIVGVGKIYCLKSTPRCSECPLQQFL